MSTQADLPVLIGLAQLTERAAEPAAAASPLDMLERIAREAAADSGAGEAAIARLDTVAVVGAIGWRPQNAPRLLAERLGVRADTELTSNVGGEMALTLINECAERILAGESRVALIAGVNNLDTLVNARKSGVDLGWERGGEGRATDLGGDRPGTSELEVHYGMTLPPNIYPMIENALRAGRGRDLEAHMAQLGALMAPFSRVASQNPHAWFPVERSAEEIATPSAANRMIAYPYTKYMNAVLYTDQAAGVILTSKGVADALGIPDAKRVYWWGGANTVERAWFVSERPRIDDSPAMRACAERTLANSGVTIDEIDHIDFYSCFPVAVEMACEAYGVAEDDPRGLTVTGGLPYAGGPANNYPTHAVVTCAQRLRANPHDKGLITGNGWYLTKHSGNVWSASPRPDDAPTSHPDAEIEVGPEPVEPIREANGAARVEAYTVEFDRDGAPAHGIVIGRLTLSDARFVANLPAEPPLLDAVLESELVGRKGEVAWNGERNVFRPL